MPIIAPLSCDERRLMQKAIHITRDKNYGCRITAVLKLHRVERVNDVARILWTGKSGAILGSAIASASNGLSIVAKFLLTGPV